MTNRERLLISISLRGALLVALLLTLPFIEYAKTYPDALAFQYGGGFRSGAKIYTLALMSFAVVVAAGVAALLPTRFLPFVALSAVLAVAHLSASAKFMYLNEVRDFYTLPTNPLDADSRFLVRLDTAFTSSNLSRPFNGDAVDGFERSMEQLIEDASDIFQRAAKDENSIGRQILEAFVLTEDERWTKEEAAAHFQRVVDGIDRIAKKKESERE